MSITLIKQARWRKPAGQASEAPNRRPLMRDHELPPIPNDIGNATRPAIRARLRALAAAQRTPRLTQV
jgi:hypothetical protein